MMEDKTHPSRSKNPFIPALQGIMVLLKKGRNFRIHTVVAVLALVVCAFFAVQPWEWAAVLILIALVLMAEALNTSVEYLCDYVSPGIHPMIKKIKDIAAGAVLICAFIAVVVGCIIFIPYLVDLIRNV